VNVEVLLNFASIMRSHYKLAERVLMQHRWGCCGQSKEIFKIPTKQYFCGVEEVVSGASHSQNSNCPLLHSYSQNTAEYEQDWQYLTLYFTADSQFLRSIHPVSVPVLSSHRQQTVLLK
jgi:hypothetical protein